MVPAKRASGAPASVHQLKVTLLGGRPPIWRRLLIPSNITLTKLHDIIQLAMGWHHSHLHQFRVGDTFYGDRTMLAGLDVLSERSARLNVVAPGKGDRLRYEYDFGDG